MQLEEMRTKTLALKGVTEDIKWENHLCFNIGSKIFLITNPDEFSESACFKASEQTFDELQRIPGVIPAPYLARSNWLYVDDIRKIPSADWTALIEEAYRLIFEKWRKTITL